MEFLLACSLFLDSGYIEAGGQRIDSDSAMKTVLSNHHYSASLDPQLMQRVIVKPEEVEGRFFHHAKVTISFTDLQNPGRDFQTVGDRRCMTQYCGISDYGQSFVDALRAFDSRLGHCP